MDAAWLFRLELEKRIETSVLAGAQLPEAGIKMPWITPPLHGRCEHHAASKAAAEQ